MSEPGELWVYEIAAAAAAHDRAVIRQQAGELFTLRQQRRAALELHRPVADGMNVLHCTTCQVDANTAAGFDIGQALRWPCPTAKALGIES